MRWRLGLMARPSMAHCRIVLQDAGQDIQKGRFTAAGRTYKGIDIPGDYYVHPVERQGFLIVSPVFYGQIFDCNHLILPQNFVIYQSFIFIVSFNEIFIFQPFNYIIENGFTGQDSALRVLGKLKGVFYLRRETPGLG